MRLTFRIILIAAIIAMSYLCVISITTPIEFEKEQVKRESYIIKDLVEIRKAQIEFKNQHGYYVSTLDSLIDFIQNGKVSVILKEGTLSDEQLKAGLTEKKAADIVRKGNKKEITANGLDGFRRDTSFVSVYETFFAERHSLESINDFAFIPYSNKEKYIMKTRMYTNEKTGITVPLFEVCAPYDTYLYDLNKQELINIKDKKSKLGAYLGLKVGSIDEPNNNAGNWE